MYHLKKNELDIIDGTKISIGERIFEYDVDFESSEIIFEDGDQFYLFSDGCTDQFGGEMEKRFMKKRMIPLIKELKGMSFDKQQQFLEERFLEWQGNNGQIDDQIFIGFKLS